MPARLFLCFLNARKRPITIPWDTGAGNCACGNKKAPFPFCAENGAFIIGLFPNRVLAGICYVENRLSSAKLFLHFSFSERGARRRMKISRRIFLGQALQ
ncbi:hypothetical protein [Heyndrickxia coagulans]|uniref:hypothetical protein n=1 Tax=Heyndrickxia coagulans TaxID=1398 RepID=UPI0018A7B763|nr:hypothetical protein [Heyndrickxia coagulans]